MQSYMPRREGLWPPAGIAESPTRRPTSSPVRRSARTARHSCGAAGIATSTIQTPTTSAVSPRPSCSPTRNGPTPAITSGRHKPLVPAGGSRRGSRTLIHCFGIDAGHPHRLMTAFARPGWHVSDCDMSLHRFPLISPPLPPTNTLWARCAPCGNRYIGMEMAGEESPI